MENSRLDLGSDYSEFSNNPQKRNLLKELNYPIVINYSIVHKNFPILRGGFRAAATSEMESFVTIVNDFQPLTIITKLSIVDVAAVLDQPLLFCCAEKNSQLF